MSDVSNLLPSSILYSVVRFVAATCTIPFCTMGAVMASGATPHVMLSR